jgi:hypothetical protein
MKYFARQNNINKECLDIEAYSERLNLLQKECQMHLEDLGAAIGNDSS